MITVVVLALVVWFVIADAENREIEARLGFSLPVEVEELGSHLAVIDEPLPVTVTVVGREADVELARPEQFKATVSLRNRAPGRHSLPVRVEAVDGDVRVRAVQPETAVVVVEETVEREAAVIVELSNPPPLGFRVGPPEVEPATAIVSGVASEVEAVDSVVARLDLAGATVGVERDVTLEARTAAGGGVGQVVISPRFARVRVPVEQELFRRAASILPDLVGVPAEGYRVRVVRTTPATVDVLVSVDVLDDEIEVRTDPVDLSDQDSSLAVLVGLRLPDGTALAADASGSTRVQVVIEPITTTIKLPVAIELTGLRANQTIVEVSPVTVQATLRGPVAVISELEGPLSPIVIDLRSYSSGRQVVDLTWMPPEGVELVELSPDWASVTLAATQTAAPEQSGSEAAIDEESVGDEESEVRDGE